MYHIELYLSHRVLSNHIEFYHIEASIYHIGVLSIVEASIYHIGVLVISITLRNLT